jgi:hypothetical protein
LSHIYLGAVAFGVTLLVASFVLGGKDTSHGHHGDASASLGWAPVASLRFWVFLFTFGGAAGLALDALEGGTTIPAIGALGIGWTSGVLAIAVIRSLTKTSTSSGVAAAELIGTTGKLLLPAGPGKPGKVRIEIKGRAEDYVARVVEDGGDLPSGSIVLIVSEDATGSLLVTRHEM